MSFQKIETRINVLGASGSGASTLGRALAKALSIPHFDSDDYYHGPSDPPFQNPRSVHERFDLVTCDMPVDQHWILSGGIAGWDPYPELRFTAVVFVVTPTDVRIKRLRERELERFGDRILQGGDMYENHEDFIAWASRYDPSDVKGKTLAKHEAYLETQTCQVIRVDGTRPVIDLTREVLNQTHPGFAE